MVDRRPASDGLETERGQFSAASSQAPSPVGGAGAAGPPAASSRWGRWASLACIILMIGLVAGPILYLELPREMTRWHLAAAIERRLNGDLEGAIRSLDHLIAEAPGNEELLLERASWRRENDQYAEALADVQRALQLDPDSPSAIILRSQIYQHLGRHREAVADMNRLVTLAQSHSSLSLSEMLNGRAYARAVGGLELDAALVDIQEALRREGENGAMLDTRGFIYYRHGQYELAQADLDKAVRLVERDYEQLVKQMQNGRLGALDARDADLRVKREAQPVAVIRYHRSLVYDGLKKPDLAELDRARVRELGCVPDPGLF